MFNHRNCQLVSQVSWSIINTPIKSQKRIKVWSITFVAWHSQLTRSQSYSEWIKVNSAFNKLISIIPSRQINFFIWCLVRCPSRQRKHLSCCETFNETFKRAKIVHTAALLPHAFLSIRKCIWRAEILLQIQHSALQNVLESSYFRNLPLRCAHVSSRHVPTFVIHYVSSAACKVDISLTRTFNIRNLILTLISRASTAHNGIDFVM